MVTLVVVDEDGNTATDTDDPVVRLVAAPVNVVPQQIVNRPVPQGTVARTGELQVLDHPGESAKRT